MIVPRKLSLDPIRTVVADPPWLPRLHRNTAGRREGKYRGGPQRHYATLEVDEIAGLQPETANKAHLWIWVLSQHIDWGYTVARAWGFEPQQMITWTKPLGLGQFQCSTEHALVCRKGGPAANSFGKTGGTHFAWRAPRRHSAKPAAFFDLVERVSPAPYLEMFARETRLGWLSWGDEVP